jgi:hypothetical protein
VTRIGENVASLVRQNRDFPERDNFRAKRQKTTHPQSTSPRMASDEAAIELSSDEGGGRISRAAQVHLSQAEQCTSQRSATRGADAFVHSSQEMRNVENKMRVTKRRTRREVQNDEHHNIRESLSVGPSPSRGASREQPVELDGDDSATMMLRDVYSLRVDELGSTERSRKLQKVDGSKSRFFTTAKHKPIQQVDLVSSDELDEVEYLPGNAAKGPYPNEDIKPIEIHEDPQENTSLRQRHRREFVKLQPEGDMDQSIDELAPAQNSFRPPVRDRECAPDAYEISDSENGREMRTHDIPSQFGSLRNNASTRKIQLTGRLSTAKSIASPAEWQWRLLKYRSIEGELEHLIAHSSAGENPEQGREKAKLKGKAKQKEMNQIIVFQGKKVEGRLDSKYNINLVSLVKTQYASRSNLVRLQGAGRQAWDLTFTTVEEAKSFVTYAMQFSKDTVEKEP